MKRFAVLLVAAALAGCASTPRPQVHVVPKQVVKKEAPAPIAQPVEQTPNQVVKARWYDRFLRHKSSK